MSIYQEITESILNNIDSAGQWSPPWRSASMGQAINVVSKHPATGINRILLLVSMMNKGYTSNKWASFKQWNSIGAKVRKGEKATRTIYYKPIEDRDLRSAKINYRFIIRHNYLFNVAQVDGYSEGSSEPSNSADETERDMDLMSFIYSTKAKILHGEFTPCYIPKHDEIRMPEVSKFYDLNGYYSTLFHELVHWTGAKFRLDRQLGQRFGDNQYAAEELIAEMGAAFLSSEWNIYQSTKDESNAYLKHWVSMMKEDSQAIIRAASMAEKAVTYLKDLYSVHQIEQQVA